MMVVKNILISEIAVEDRLRPVDPERGKALAFAIDHHGLINPITVRHVPAKRGRNYMLVAGAHRLWAVASLGHSHIQAIVVKASSDEAQMLEIGENFFHSGLSVIDRAAFGERFRELWEENVGPVQSRKPRDVGVNLAPIFEGRFKEAVARSLGVSASGAKRLHRIAINLNPRLRDVLRGTPHAENESLLLKLAKLPLDDQVKVAAAFSEHPDLTAALKLARPDKGRKDEKQRREDVVMTAWNLWSTAERAAFLEKVGAMMKPMPSGFDLTEPLISRPAPGNASPLRDWAAEPRALVDVWAAKQLGYDAPAMPRKKAAPKLSKKDAELYIRLSVELREKLDISGGLSSSALIRLCSKLDVPHQRKMAEKLWRSANLELAIETAENLLKDQKAVERIAMRGTKAPPVEPLKRGPFKGLIPSLAEGFLPSVANDAEFMTALRALPIEGQETARVLLLSGMDLDAVQAWAREQRPH